MPESGCWLVRLLERSDASKLSALCHPSCTTNGRTYSTVAGSHKPYGRSHRGRPRCALSVSLRPFPPLRSVRTSHCLARSRQMCLIPPPLSALCLLSRSLVPSSAGVHFTWHSAGFCPPLQASPRLSPTLCLPIVHNYTIRLLNRLMRPPLPAAAAPFTETTGRARARPPSSLSLRRSVSFVFLEIRRLSPIYPRSRFFYRAFTSPPPPSAGPDPFTEKLFTRASF